RALQGGANIHRIGSKFYCRRIKAVSLFSQVNYLQLNRNFRQGNSNFPSRKVQRDYNLRWSIRLASHLPLALNIWNDRRFVLLRSSGEESGAAYSGSRIIQRRQRKIYKHLISLLLKIQFIFGK